MAGAGLGPTGPQDEDEINEPGGSELALILFVFFLALVVYLVANAGW